MAETALTLDRDGAQLHPAALTSAEFNALGELGQSHAEGTAGERRFGDPLVARLTGPESTMRRIAAARLGLKAQPVRAVLFDKSAANNWPLGWHQDRVIAVKARADVDGFGPFTVKQGILHVQPPASVIAGMVTLRAHLDLVDADNSLLLVTTGSPWTCAREHDCGGRRTLRDRGLPCRARGCLGLPHPDPACV